LICWEEGYAEVAESAEDAEKRGMGKRKTEKEDPLRRSATPPPEARGRRVEIDLHFGVWGGS